MKAYIATQKQILIGCWQRKIMMWAHWLFPSSQLRVIHPHLFSPRISNLQTTSVENDGEPRENTASRTGPEHHAPLNAQMTHKCPICHTSFDSEELMRAHFKLWLTPADHAMERMQQLLVSNGQIRNTMREDCCCRKCKRQVQEARALLSAKHRYAKWIR